MAFFMNTNLGKDVWAAKNLSRNILWIVGSVAALTISAKIQIPLPPVPITLQTAVVLALPCLMGMRLALASIATYLALGFSGAPVFAMAAGSILGPAYLMGPTGGYLIGFMAAAALVGYLYQVKEKQSWLALMAMMLIGHAVIMLSGFIWLAYGMPSLGVEKAWLSGIVPFLYGSVVKSLIAACVVTGLQRTK